MLDPPVPLTAVFRPISPVLDVTFDKALRPGPLNAANWTGRNNNISWTVTFLPAAAGPMVTIITVPGPPDPGPNVTNYAASPADVVSTPGLVPAASFLDFPTT